MNSQKIKPGWYAARSEMNSDRSIGYETKEYFISNKISREEAEEYCHSKCLGNPYWLNEDDKQVASPIE